MHRLAWQVARRGLMRGAAAVACAASLAASPATSLQAQPASPGPQVYEEFCSFCHGGGGEGIADFTPALAGNPLVEDVERVKEIVRGGRDTDAWADAMPAFTDLSADDIAAVAAFVQAGLTAAPAASVEAALAPFDDAARSRGERLFLGRESSQNGSPACVACHAAGRHGNPARTLGVDLTGLFAKYGDAGRVMAVVQAPPSAVMRPIFADKPLTDEEAHALAAFFEATSDETASDGADTVVVLGLAGLLVLFGLMVTLMWRPREGYARRLRRQA